MYWPMIRLCSKKNHQSAIISPSDNVPFALCREKRNDDISYLMHPAKVGHKQSSFTETASLSETTPMIIILFWKSIWHAQHSICLQHSIYFHYSIMTNSMMYPAEAVLWYCSYVNCIQCRSRSHNGGIRVWITPTNQKSS